jgi:universal stress protein A
MTITRILVPTDFSADADAALTCALGLAQRFGASIDLLHVVEGPLAAGVWSSEFYTAHVAGLLINLVRDAEQRLRNHAASHGGPITTEVRTGPAARAILDFTRERAFDLIVMGTYGRTGLARVVMGSVAERIVRLAPCPVLTLRAETLTAAARKA